MDDDEEPAAEPKKDDKKPVTKNGTPKLGKLVQLSAEFF